MDTVDPHDAEDALAALLHRLASPLGAIANFAYLLPEQDASHAREGILTAMANVRATLLDAQRWLDALATTRAAVPDEGVDLGAALRDAAEQRGQEVRIASALPRVALPHATAARLARALLSGAAGSGGGAGLRVEGMPGDAVHLVVASAGRTWSLDEAARAFDLFSPRVSGSNDAHGELALAGSLARRLGGRAWGAVGPGGEALFHVVLPAVPPAVEHHEERQDA